MLKIEFIGGFNPFLWDKLTCPVCNGRNFTSVSMSGVYCDDCNCKFRVRDTAGDPGCVVDCFVGVESERVSVYAPLWECPHCKDSDRHARFDWQDLICPFNLNHGPMQRCKGTSGPWNRPDKFPDYFYLILKTGDYCSGWLLSGGDLPRAKDRKGPTQKEWEAFQASEEFRQVIPGATLIDLTR